MFFKAAFVAVVCLHFCASQVYSQIKLPVIQPPEFSFCSPQNQCCDANTISASGSTTFQAQPDLASISTQVSASGKTTSDAVAALSVLVNSILGVLTSNGLSKDNYQTSNFNVYPNTTWRDGVSTVNGQIASQSFEVTLPFVAGDGSSIGKLIDGLASVNGVTINNLSFDIKNKTAAFFQARRLAFQDAQAKAKDYAEALFLRLGRVLHVADSFSSAPVVTSGEKVMSLMVGSADAVSTNVEVGTIPISYNVQLVFSFS